MNYAGKPVKELKSPKKKGVAPDTYLYSNGQLIDKKMALAADPPNSFFIQPDGTRRAGPEPADPAVVAEKPMTASELTAKRKADDIKLTREQKRQAAKVEREAGQLERVYKDQLGVVTKRIDELRQQSEGRSC